MKFIEYNQEPKSYISTFDKKKVASFVTQSDSNFDKKTIDSFGEEWLKFDAFTSEEINIAGNQYFDIVNDTVLHENSVVLDLGCGSGRWTKFIAKKVKLVEAVDPSLAIYSSVKLNHDEQNVRITQASVSNIPFNDESFNFVVCLGVLHHIPDTQQALIDVVKKLKPGGSILLYLYYKIDNRGVVFKTIFKISTVFRFMISKMPKTIKKITCDLIAIFVYYPFVLLTRILQLLFGKKTWIENIPLSYYSDKSFHIIRNDSLDRFGTPLEQRFSKNEIDIMMKNAGLGNIRFSDNKPYWHMLGIKL